MRSAAWWRGSPIRRVGYVCGQLRLEGEGGENQEGALLALRDGRPRASSRAWPASPPGNGAINAVRREAYIALEPTRGQDISFPFELTKRGWRAVFEPGGGRPGADGGDARLGVPAQATDARRRLGDDAPPRDALAARLPARLRVRDPLAPRAALCVADPPPDRAGGEPRAPRAGLASTSSPSRAQLALLAAAALAPVVPLRAFRLARYYVAVTAASAAGPLGLPAPWRARDLGEGRGHAVSAAARRGCRGVVDLTLAGVGLVAREPAAGWSRRSRSSSTRAGPVIYRQRRVGKRRAASSSSTSCARCTRAPTRWASARRCSRAIRASPGSGACCAASRWTRCRTSSTCCAGRWRSSARVRRLPPRWSCTRRASAAGSRCKPGITGWAQVNGRAGIPWEERIELDVWYVDHRSRGARPADPGPHRAPAAHRPRPLR